MICFYFIITAFEYGIYPFSLAKFTREPSKSGRIVKISALPHVALNLEEIYDLVGKMREILEHGDQLRVVLTFVFLLWTKNCKIVVFSKSTLTKVKRTSVTTMT